MSDTKRDPRIDPKVGDVLQKGDRVRTVRSCSVYPTGEYVGWHGNGPQNGKRNSVGCLLRLDSWREWARKADVIYMPQSSEFPIIPDERLRKYTDPARYGPELVAICLELLAARERLARIDAMHDELAQSEAE